MSDTPELKPCWHCEGEDVEVFYSPSMPLTQSYRGHCMGCHALGPTSDDRAEAVALWNTRPGEERLRQENDGLLRLYGEKDTGPSQEILRMYGKAAEENEREECAKIAEEITKHIYTGGGHGDPAMGAGDMAKAIAAAIRKRGEKA